jgi:hypothetical protein
MINIHLLNESNQTAPLVADRGLAIVKPDRMRAFAQKILSDLEGID